MGYLIAFGAGVLIARWPQGRRVALKVGLYGLAVFGALAALALLI